MTDQEKKITEVIIYETDNVLVAASFAIGRIIFIVYTHYGGMVKLVKQPLVWKMCFSH